MPTQREPSFEFLVSLAASTIDRAALPSLTDWRLHALGRPPRPGEDPVAEKLPTDAAAVSMFIRAHQDELFRRICGVGEGAYCGLGKLSGRARQEMVDGIAELIDGALDEVPTKLLAAVLVRLGLEQYCTCRGVYHCGGVTLPGMPCRRRVGEPGGLCWQHAHQRGWYARA